jgi:hypothetical protein
MLEYTKNRKQCNQSADGRYSAALLKRLGDVGEAKIPIIYSTDVDQGSQPQYITVRHRWDQGPVPKLLQSNAHKFQRGFDVETLP